MRVLLIEPSVYTEQGLYKVPIRATRYLALVLPHLAALTPADIEVEIAYDACENLDSECDFASYDLVGITAQTIHMKRTLELARKVTKAGRPVVVGGPATREGNHQLVPVLARFCTSVVVGEAEELWLEFLNDLKQGNPKKVYQDDNIVSLKGLPVPRFDLVDLSCISEPHVLPCMTSRGCPRACTFCSYRSYSKWRMRPVDEVIAELSVYKTRFGIPRVVFRDDDFLVHPGRSREILEKMIPLELEWGCQTDLSLSNHADLVDLAIKSGMRSVSLGLESIVEKNRNAVRKSFFAMDEAEDLLQTLYEREIEVQVNIMFGFDHDTPDVFDETVDFLVRNHVGTALFSILLPIPGTPIHKQLLTENRLIDDRLPGSGDHLYVGFIPKHMTVERLVEGYLHAQQRFQHERKDPVLWLGKNNHIWSES